MNFKERSRENLIALDRSIDFSVGFLQPPVQTLVDHIKRLGTTPGRSATALPGLWFFRGDRPGSFTRAQAPMMYLAVAVSGKKLVRVGGLTFSNDRWNYLVLRGETNYEAAIAEASPKDPYLAMGLQIPPDIVARTLLEMADVNNLPQDDDTAMPPAFVGVIDSSLADPLCRILATLDDAAERRVVAPLCLREIVFRLLRSKASDVLRGITNKERSRIAKVMRYIDEHSSKKLSVELLPK